MADRTLEIKLVGDASKLQAAFKSAGADAEAMSKKFSGGLHSAFGTATKDSETLGSKLSGGVHSALTKVATAAGVVAAGGIVALGKGLVDGVKLAGNFEQELNVLKAVTQGTGAQMADASKLAIKLGADTHLPAVSAADAAKAMLELGKAGFTMGQSMAAARGTLLLATAAETDAGLAAKTVTQNINAFGLKAKDTNQIVDQMAGFMNTTGTSFDAFRDSLSYVAAPAHTVGQNFKETAAQLAILSKNGIEGSMAGTGLRQMLVRLGSDTGKAHDAFKKLGIETIGANGKFIGIRATIEKLHPVLDKMTSSQRLTLMKEAFGQTAMNQANVLLGTLPSKYDAVTASIGKSGQANDLAASHMKGFRGAMAAFQSTIETLEIEIGLKLLPVLTRLINWVNSNMPRIQSIGTTAFNKISEAVSDATAVGKVIYDTYERHTTLFKTVGAVVLTMVAAIEAITLAVKAWTAVQLALDVALTANPIGIVIVAIAALAAGMVVLYQNSATARDVINQAFTAIKTVGGAVIDFFNNVALPAFRAAWPLVSAAVQTAVTAVTAQVTGVKTTLEGVFNLVGDLIHGRWSNLWGDAQQIVTGVVTTINAALAGLPAKLLGLVGDFTSAAAKLGGGIVSGILDALAGIGGKAINVVNDVVAGVIGLIDNAGNAGERVGTRIVSGVLGGLAGIGAKALGVINNVIDEVNQVAQDVWSAAERIGERIVSGVLAGLSGLFSSLKSKIEGIIGGVLAKLDIPGNSPPDIAFRNRLGMPMGKGVVEGFGLGIKDFQPTVEQHLGLALTATTAAVTPITAAPTSFPRGGDVHFTIINNGELDENAIVEKISYLLGAA